MTVHCWEPSKNTINVFDQFLYIIMTSCSRKIGKLCNIHPWLRGFVMKFHGSVFFSCLSGDFLNKTLFKYNLTPNDQGWILVYRTWRVVLNFLLQKNWIGTPTRHAVTILRRWAHKRRDEWWPSLFEALFSTLGSVISFDRYVVSHFIL